MGAILKISKHRGTKLLLKRKKDVDRYIKGRLQEKQITPHLTV